MLEMGGGRATWREAGADPGKRFSSEPRGFQELECLTVRSCWPPRLLCSHILMTASLTP